MRLTNIELCRIVSIILVVLVHSNFYWCGWPEDLASCRIPMLFVEAIAIIGVNVFVLITGYFSASIKTKTFVNLFYICFFYAIIRLLVGGITGHLSMKDCLFISNSNWFIPAYIGLILLTPWLNAVQMSHKMGGVIIALLFFEIYFGYFPAKTQVIPGINHGYSVFSFSILYLIARYIRHWGVPMFFKKHSMKIYLLCSFIITISGYALVYLYEGRNVNIPKVLKHFVYAYNNPLVIVSSVAFFITFVKMNIKQSNVINHIAQSAIAVLLVHTSTSNNGVMITYFKEALQNDSPFIIVILWIIGIITIFVISILIDQLRIYSYKYIGPKVINTIDNHILKRNK